MFFFAQEYIRICWYTCFNRLSTINVTNRKQTHPKAKCYFYLQKVRKEIVVQLVCDHKIVRFQLTKSQEVFAMSLRNGHARWAFDLSMWRPTIGDLQRAIVCVQPEERDRLAKFMFRDDFNASLIGRLLLRKFVRDTTAIPYDEIQFVRDDRGKPRLAKAHPNIDFNVSHQGGYAVLAGCMATNDHHQSSVAPSIGVDVMKIEYSGGKPLAEFFRLMHRNFSNDEWSYIKGATTQFGQTEAFMRHWCLKESYVKNIGVGITVDLQQISFSVGAPVLSHTKPVTDASLTVNGMPVEHWVFEESRLGDDHCVAVALNYARPTEQQHVVATPFELIDFERLIDGSRPLSEVDSAYCTTVASKQYKNQ